jgi:hypothetical protein
MATHAFDERSRRLLDARFADCGWPGNPDLHWQRFHDNRITARCTNGHKLIAKQRRNPDGTVTRYWAHLSRVASGQQRCAAGPWFRGGDRSRGP